MLKPVKRPEDIFDEITADFQDAFGTELVSLILYGSGTGEQYQPGKSDLNFLIILTGAGIDELELGIAPVVKWKKRMMAPIFMTKDYIRLSIDSYPVEFFNMKSKYRVIFGEDVLKDLSFEPCDFRLQLERELKGKFLHLQQGFLQCEGNDKGLRELIAISLDAYVHIFKGLLFLRGYEVPSGRRDVIKALSLAYSINPDVFLHCLDIRERRSKFSSREVKELFKSYWKEIEKLTISIDHMQV